MGRGWGGGFCAAAGNETARNSAAARQGRSFISERLLGRGCETKTREFSMGACDWTRSGPIGKPGRWHSGSSTTHREKICHGCILLLRAEMNLVFCECEVAP